MRLWSKFLPIAAATALWVGAPATPAAAQQTGTLTGTVTDITSGRPLESAQAFLPALNQGGLSNAQGRFIVLDVPVGTHEVRVELIGYETATQQVTIQAGQTATVEFQLNSTALRLQELVVTGVAGETPRVKLPFTVEKVDFEDMPVPAPSAEGLVQAKVPGAKVVKGSGQPGQSGDIMFRGPTSITGSQSPLIIVDGIITDNTLADISSLDIQSIEMVKGAAGASLYGSRAQNGVIQITTRRGANLRIDQSRMTLRNEYGIQNLEGTVPLSQYHPYRMEGGEIVDVDGNVVDMLVVETSPALQTGSPATSFQDQPYPSSLKLYDHVEEMFKPGDFISSYAAVEGRTGSTNYRASMTFQDEQGVLPEFNDGFQLKGFRLNLDHEVRDNFNISLSTYYSTSKQEDIGSSQVFYDLTFLAPYAPIRQRDPSTIGNPACPEEGCFLFKPDPLSQEGNPLYPLELLDNRDERTRFLGAVSAVWSPLSWFELEGQYSVDRADGLNYSMTPPGYQSDQSGFSTGSLNKSQSMSNDVNASITASINKAFGDLTTRTRLRYLMEDQHSEGFSASGRDFAALGVPTLDNMAGAIDAGSSISDVISEGYFFITALDYQGKYVGDFLVRRDGSSLFGPDERWQTYYRASGAWRLAQEDWWPIDMLDEFKLRYSIGTAGGRPNFSAQYETFSVSNGIIRPVNLGNSKLKPELATEQEVGLETVWFNKISSGLTYAWNTVEDQLLAVPLAAPVGFTSQWQNAGDLKSNTVEFYVETALVDRADMTWTSRLNFDRTRQIITRLGIAPYRSGFGYIREGESLGTFYGTRWATSCSELPTGSDCSQYQVNDDGLLVWVGEGNSYTEGVSKSLWGTSGTENGESRSWGIPIAAQDANGDEFLRMGTTTPDFNLSLGNTFRWKNLSFYTLFDGEFGADIYNQTRGWAYRDRRSADQDQFGKPDELKKTINYYQTLYNTNSNSSWFVEDGTYVKLREMSLRYTFDAEQVESVFGGLGLDGLQVNLIGRNLLTWTDYKGYDPEVSSGSAGGSGDVLGRVDSFGYPNFRTFTASLELIF